MSHNTITAMAIGVLVATVAAVRLGASDGVAQGRSPTQTITLRAAAAFDGKGRTIPNVTIVVANGTIADVRSGEAVPATYELRGVTLLPGLIDTHVHLDT